MAAINKVCSLVPRPSYLAVACNTNTGDCLIKLVTHSDVPRHLVDVWGSHTFPENWQVIEQATTSDAADE